MALAIKSNEIPGSKVIRYRKGGRPHHKVRIYLNGTDEELKDIHFVKYILHPTFKNPERIAVDRSDKFAIEIRTYGFFEIKALLNGEGEPLVEQVTF